MKSVFFLTLNLLALNLFAQQFTSIQISEKQNDSSFYDILKIDESNFWVAGEKGILVNLSSTFKQTDIQYPNEGLNILKIGKFSNNHIVLCADKGTIYHYYVAEKKWKTQHIQGFKNKVLYNFVAFNDKIAFICGGNSKIALSKKAIPGGFILKTEDGGLSWKKIYSSKGSMIWDVDLVNNNLVALKYNIFGTRLLTINSISNKMISKSQCYKMLAHEYNPSLKMLLGANDYHIYKSGKAIFLNKTESSLNCKSLIWDVAILKNKIIGSSCNGKLIILNPNTTTQSASEIQSPTKFNLYGIIAANENDILLIGSNKTIFKLTFNN
jgi:hypothetical protein